MRRTIDRRSGQLQEEQVYKDRKLRLLYDTAWGRLLGKLYVTKPGFSKRYGKRMRRPASARLIEDFIRENRINRDDYEERVWESFADFFVREPLPERRPWPTSPRRLGSPADARLTVHEITQDSKLLVKGFTYTIESLLGDKADRYAGGLALVFRLTVADIHRFYYPDGCRIPKPPKQIPGRLHTVGPYSDKRVPVFTENSRVVTYLETEHFGTLAMVEVGALTIGSIVNHQRTAASRGSEKGWFEPGGSTIVLLTEAGAIDIDEDILTYNRQCYEVLVRIGEGIATRTETADV